MSTRSEILQKPETILLRWFTPDNTCTGPGNDSGTDPGTSESYQNIKSGRVLRNFWKSRTSNIEQADSSMFDFLGLL